MSLGAEHTGANVSEPGRDNHGAEHIKKNIVSTGHLEEEKDEVRQKVICTIPTVKYREVFPNTAEALSNCH